MSMKTKYILVLIVVVIVAWSIAAGFMIIPRLIFKQPIAAIPTIATNATNADIVHAIYSLKDTIYAANYGAMGVGIGILITAFGVGTCVIIAVIVLK